VDVTVVELESDVEIVVELESEVEVVVEVV
jgi:hypothetical protein